MRFTADSALHLSVASGPMVPELLAPIAAERLGSVGGCWERAPHPQVESSWSWSSEGCYKLPQRFLAFRVASGHLNDPWQVFYWFQGEVHRIVLNNGSAGSLLKVLEKVHLHQDVDGFLYTGVENVVSVAVGAGRKIQPSILAQGSDYVVRRP